MSDQNPYEKLGVSEEASFEEIQDVRNRLIEQYSGDAKRLEIIEAAYDAILMDRLRMRQEGKIKVPERIRFPERLMQAAPKESSTPRDQSRAWLQKFLDQPTPADIIVPGACYLGLSAISLFYQVGSDQILQLALVFGVGSSIYFLNRKENKFGRAVLFTLLGLVVGLITGGLVYSLIGGQITQFVLPNQFSTVLTFILLWLINSFIR
jgi:Protein CHAPERONE-LIKE PROTEIN OF POR1-like